MSGLTIYVKSAQNINIFFYDYNKAYLGNNSEGLRSNIKNTEITLSSKARYFRIATNQIPYNHDISINYQSSDTDYHAYNGNTYTFVFGQTVYGGSFDNKGNLVVTYQVVETTWGALTSKTRLTNYTRGSLNISSYGKGINVNPNDICNVAPFKANYSSDDCHFYVAVNGEYTSVMLFLPNDTSNDTAIKIVYELATPITLSITSQDIPTSITSQDIPTLLGENNIFSNCGNVEVNYYTNKAKDILEFIDSEIGKKNGTNIPIEENSQDSIKDYVDDEISSTKDYVDNGLNEKVAYKSDEVVYSNYVTGAYVSGSGNYVEFCIPINTKATSGTITNLGTTLNVFIGSTRLTNEVTLSDSSIVAIKDGYAQIELKLNSTQTANSVATVSLDGFTVNFA